MKFGNLITEDLGVKKFHWKKVTLNYFGLQSCLIIIVISTFKACINVKG